MDYHDVVKKVEAVQTEYDEGNNTLQVSAKLLNFDFLFNGDADSNNGEMMLQLLAELGPENDDIFSTKHIQAFVNYMWQVYYWQLVKTLVFPFFFYSSSFLVFGLYFKTDTRAVVNGDIN